MTNHALLALLSLTWFDPAAGPVAAQAPGSACDAAMSLPPSVPADSLDKRPAAISSTASLRYPRGPAMTGVTGDVLLEYDVDSTGAVDRCSIRIIETKRPEFAASATAYVAGLRFAPPTKNGVAVRARVQQRIRFRKTDGSRGRHHFF